MSNVENTTKLKWRAHYVIVGVDHTTQPLLEFRLVFEESAVRQSVDYQLTFINVSTSN